MSGLKVTPARLALLRAVAAGDVYRPWCTGKDYQNLGEGTWPKTVTSQLRPMRFAAWVKLESGPLGRSRYWRLTTDGLAVLDKANGGTS